MIFPHKIKKTARPEMISGRADFVYNYVNLFNNKLLSVDDVHTLLQICTAGAYILSIYVVDGLGCQIVCTDAVDSSGLVDDDTRLIGNRQRSDHELVEVGRVAVTADNDGVVTALQ